MADRVDSMSDAELRTKLAEHGFPIMPITASTRKLLVKKLKLVLDNKSGDARNGSAAAEKRRSLARYSSGEDSDLDADAGRQRRGRRTTTGGAMPPPSAARARRPTPKKDSPVKNINEEDRGSESDEENRGPIKTHEEVETVTTRRVTRLYKPTDEYETGSDSDVDVEKKSSPFRSDSRSSDYISSTLAPDSPHVSPPKPSILSSRPSISTSGYTRLSGAESLSSIRQRLGLSSGLTDRPLLSTTRPASIYTSSYKSSTGTDEVESPYLSSFAQRLSTLAAEPMRAAPMERDDGGAAYVRKPYITSAPRAQSDYRVADRKFLPSNVVSLALVVVVALFFFFLFSVYLVRRNDMAAIVDDENAIIPICQLNIPGNRPGINCVPKEQVSHAKSVLSRVRPELSQRAAAFKCAERDAVPFLTEREIVELCAGGPLMKDREQIRTDLYNLHVLLLNNPKWGVSVVEMKRAYDRGIEHTSLKETNELPLYRSSGNLALMLTDPSTPIFCLLTSTLYSAGSTVLLLAVFAASGYFAHRGWKMYVAYNKRKEEEIYSMVEQIIDVISQECEDSEEPYISVNHVRDMLIAPQNRNKMASAWESAIAFIKKNESRVRMEVQSVDGEDCEVWRWISPRGGSPRVGAAAWQGQAFETQEGSVNNLSVSPTPCLKIRHMFDKSDNNMELRSVVQDAILEKVGDQCSILHIDLDRATCCVYVKCASPKDAGVVYKSLHGWWYKGKLITVKYLRLERYMVRFPNSPSVGPYLKLSRNRHSSWNN